MQASSREASELERFRREGEGVIEAELAVDRGSAALFTPLVDLIELRGVLLVLVLGTRAIADGVADARRHARVHRLPDAASTARCATSSSLSNTFFKALAGAERVIELLDERPRVDRRGRDAPRRAPRGAIEFDDVCVQLSRRRRPALGA